MDMNANVWPRAFAPLVLMVGALCRVTQPVDVIARNPEVPLYINLVTRAEWIRAPIFGLTFSSFSGQHLASCCYHSRNTDRSCSLHNPTL